VSDSASGYRWKNTRPASRPVSKADKSRRRVEEAAGLGLAIARTRVVEMHRGMIRVKSGRARASNHRGVAAR